MDSIKNSTKISKDFYHHNKQNQLINNLNQL